MIAVDGTGDRGLILMMEHGRTADWTRSSARSASAPTATWCATTTRPRTASSGPDGGHPMGPVPGAQDERLPGR